MVTNGDKGGRGGQKSGFLQWHTFWMAPKRTMALRPLGNHGLETRGWKCPHFLKTRCFWSDLIEWNFFEILKKFPNSPDSEPQYRILVDWDMPSRTSNLLVHFRVSLFSFFSRIMKALTFLFGKYRNLKILRFWLKNNNFPWYWRHQSWILISLKSFYILVFKL